jgi:hypothetical protein
VRSLAKYTDDEIRKMKKITCKIAADYLGVSTMAISWGMREEKLPIGFTVHNKDRYTDSYGYHIVAERLIAYNHGTISEVQVQGIENNLEKIIKEFEEMKQDLSFLLRQKNL